MNVAVISGKDADNFVLINICKELESRGHRLTVFSVYNNPHLDGMLSDLSAPIKKFADLTEDIAAEYDCALFANTLLDDAVFINMYSFVYSPLTTKFLTTGADFCFGFCDRPEARFQLHSAQMTVGNPKNDSVDLAYDRQENKQILYIDSGHIPFGEEGKSQIASMLLRICGENPGYKLVIKPRWLRGVDVQMTHTNRTHIYDLIERLAGDNLPDNLVMLNEHFDIHELIQKSDTVITLQSGAVFDVLTHGKGLCVVTGYANDDKHDIRLASLARDDRFYGRCGCLVDIADVCKYMPHGIKSDGKFLNEILPEPTGACARIADVMEHVVGKFLKNGKYPRIARYSYDTYKDEMVAGRLTWDELRQIRFENTARFYASLVFENLSAPLDWEELYAFISNNYDRYSGDKKGFDTFMWDFRLCHNRILLKNREKLSSNGIDQSYVIRAMFESGYDDELLSMRPEDILCDGPWQYYAARVKYERAKRLLNFHRVEQGKENLRQSAGHFIRYLRDADSRPYEKYEMDWPDDMAVAYHSLFDAYDGVNIPAEDMREAFAAMYKRGQQNSVSIQMRKKAFEHISVALLHECGYADINTDGAQLEGSYRRLRLQLSNLK